ncbi:MAG: hypothetical protein WC945_05855, partial [Bacteroidales bacterium]
NFLFVFISWLIYANLITFAPVQFFGSILLLGLSTMIVALGVTYFLIKKAGVKKRLHNNKPTDNTK